MKKLFPILYLRMIQILPNHTVASVNLQHHILKIFYASMQVCFNRYEGIRVLSGGGDQGMFPPQRSMFPPQRKIISVINLYS